MSYAMRPPKIESDFYHMVPRRYDEHDFIGSEANISRLPIASYFSDSHIPGVVNLTSWHQLAILGDH